MKEWEKELQIYRLMPAPPKENNLQKYNSRAGNSKKIQPRGSGSYRKPVGKIQSQGFQKVLSQPAFRRYETEGGSYQDTRA